MFVPSTNSCVTSEKYSMKMLIGDIFFSDVGSLCNNYQGPPVNLWTVGTVGQQFVSVSYVLLLVPYCGKKCLHLPSSLFGAIQLNALSRQLCTQKTQNWISESRFKHLHCMTFRMLLLLQGKCWTFELMTHISMKLLFTKNCKEILIAVWRPLPWVMYILYIYIYNIFIWELTSI
jgi:hypothetical protein